MTEAFEQSAALADSQIDLIAEPAPERSVGVNGLPDDLVKQPFPPSIQSDKNQNRTTENVDKQTNTTSFAAERTRRREECEAIRNSGRQTKPERGRQVVYAVRSNTGVNLRTNDERNTRRRSPRIFHQPEESFPRRDQARSIRTVSADFCTVGYRSARRLQSPALLDTA